MGTSSSKKLGNDENEQLRHPQSVALLVYGFVRSEANMNDMTIPTELYDLLISFYESDLYWSSVRKASNIRLSNMDRTASNAYSWTNQYSTVAAFGAIPSGQITSWRLNVNLVRTWSGNQIFGIVSNEFQDYGSFAELSQSQSESIWRHMYGIDDAKGKVYDGQVTHKQTWKPLIPKQCDLVITADFTSPGFYTLLFVLDGYPLYSEHSALTNEHIYSIRMHKHSHTLQWYPAVTLTMDSKVTIHPYTS